MSYGGEESSGFIVDVTDVKLGPEQLDITG